jgi:hypothetical protein
VVVVARDKCKLSMQKGATARSTNFLRIHKMFRGVVKANNKWWIPFTKERISRARLSMSISKSVPGLWIVLL